MKTSTSTLADIATRVDRMIAQYKPVILAILNGLTAESPYVAALFDGADPDGLKIYRDLGFEAPVDPRVWTVLDILQKPLDGALRKHNYVPIDEQPAYEAGTVLLFVFTMSVVVARRFEKGEADITTLREVRRARDVQFTTRIALEGAAAIEVILQRCAPLLQQLWDRGNERVALIEKASHGAKVAYIERSVAVTGLEEAGERAPAGERDSYRHMAEGLAAGPIPGKVHCVFNGWGTIQVLHLESHSLGGSPPRYFDNRDEELLHDMIVACRDRKRALGLLMKCQQKLGDASPAAPSLAELVALLRDAWQDCDAIQAKIPIVTQAAMPFATTDVGKRLRGALVALTQATTERQRGGAVNARGGRA
jgi:hypothetical protein